MELETGWMQASVETGMPLACKIIVELALRLSLLPVTWNSKTNDLDPPFLIEHFVRHHGN